MSEYPTIISVVCLRTFLPGDCPYIFFVLAVLVVETCMHVTSVKELNTSTSVMCLLVFDADMTE